MGKAARRGTRPRIDAATMAIVSRARFASTGYADNCEPVPHALFVVADSPTERDGEVHARAGLSCNGNAVDRGPPLEARMHRAAAFRHRVPGDAFLAS